jgi:hypothetical protein
LDKPDSGAISYAEGDVCESAFFEDPKKNTTRFLEVYKLLKDRQL